MKKKIKEIMQDIEKHYNLKILFAIENGSRIWRMASKDSDYDVRFVFVRQIEDYLKLNSLQDVIAIQKYLPEIDIVGFDIYKFCRMLESSNPQTIEWLKSDIIYYGEQPKILVDFTDKCKKISLFYHYRSMCKNNYVKYLKSHNKVTYKKYLYAMRGLVNALFIKKYMEVPPISFPELLNLYPNIVPEVIRIRLFDIIKLKKEGREQDIIQNIVNIDDYIEEFLKTEEWDNEKEDMIDTRILEEFILKKLNDGLILRGKNRVCGTF